MATLRLLYSYVVGEFEKALAEMEKPIAEASWAAIREAGEELKTDAQRDIAAAGFSRRWQTGFKVKYFPKGNKPVIDAVAFGYHRFGYANVFETGAHIAGKPLLWIPLSTTPKKIGGKRITPRLYREKVGPLQFVKRPGGRPLLFARAGGRSRAGKVSLSSLKKGASGVGPKRSVPLFVGLDSVNIRKRFHIAAIAQRIRDKLAELYVKNFKAD